MPSSHSCLGDKQSSTSAVGFQSASSLLKASSSNTAGITSSRTFSIPSTSIKSPVTAGNTPVTYQRDKTVNDENTKSISVNHALSSNPEFSCEGRQQVTTVDILM